MAEIYPVAAVRLIASDTVMTYGIMTQSETGALFIAGIVAAFPGLMR